MRDVVTRAVRRRQTLTGLVFIAAFLLLLVAAMFALSTLFGVAGVDGG